MSTPCEEKHALSSELRSNLSASWTGMIHWDVAMADYCTFRAGGKAEGLLVASTRTELATLMSWLRRNEVRWRVIGRGSNILVNSKGFSGVVFFIGGVFFSVVFIDDKADGE
jgi:UDP-N-acetylmuramate dehydrogenase